MANRVHNIEYMRGLAMFGVIAIHVGSQAAEAPAVLSPHLFLFLEIFSRFCVSLFFFVSAFGLFSSHPLDKPMAYGKYYKRRIEAVLIPYLVWSLFYIAVMPPITDPDELLSSIPWLLFFGIGAYHLYFMVILIWFYIFFPLWRAFFARSDAFVFPAILLLFPLQYWFNQYSTQVFSLSSVSDFWRPFFYYRLHTWPLHYLFPFFLGAFAATRRTWWNRFIGRQHLFIVAFFAAAAYWLASDYYALLATGAPLETAANTLQQLSLPGSTFFVAATLLLYLILAPSRLLQPLQQLFSYLSKHSYAVYLVHPLMLAGLDAWRVANDLSYSTEITLYVYFGTALLSLAASMTFNALSAFPLGGRILGRLLLGKK